MTIPGTKCSVVLAMVSLCATAILLIACWYNLMLKLRIAFAREQIETFELMQARADASDVRGALECLEYTVSYYPTGTKQVADSALNEIVETARQHSMKDIIATLRRKTGEDFGSDPESWKEGLGSGPGGPTGLLPRVETEKPLTLR